MSASYSFGARSCGDVHRAGGNRSVVASRVRLGLALDQRTLMIVNDRAT